MTYPEPGVGSPITPAYESPIQPQTDQQAKAPKPERNKLALIALIVSIVGFIFACIPGALIVGWVLLPVAFILAIVSLFLKGSGKGLGIAGLILSIVGTIVAIVVFLVVVASSIDEAFSDESVVVEASQAPADDAPEEEAASAAAGTRENPAAMGSTASSDDWTVVVNSFNPDGAAAVAEANTFNEPAPAGSHYGIANYTVTYTGEESSYAVSVGVDLVTESGNVINSYDSLVVLGDGMGLDELFNGASATGSAAFVIPDGEAVLLRVRPGMLADDVFVTP